MKNIKDLKEAILAKTAGNVFVFNGEEWAVKKHYIEKIAEDYKTVTYLRDTEELSDSIASRGLFRKKTLYVVPHDLEFLKANAKEMESIIRRAKESSNGVIWIYSTDFNKTFISHFDEFITDFEEVEEDIFKELVTHEMKLLPDHLNKLCRNCNRNFGMALMELDKIRNYAQHENISNDVAFEDLYMNGLLNIVKDKFDCKEFMNHFLIGDFVGLKHSLGCLYDVGFENSWYYLEEMVTDLKIAYCFVKYGKFDGASRAYNTEGLFWGRTKELRDAILPWDYSKCKIPWSAEDLQYLIYRLSELDYKAKKGKVSGREVIESIFYYDV